VSLWSATRGRRAVGLLGVLLVSALVAVWGTARTAGAAASGAPVSASSINDLVGSMTLDEKLAMVSGWPLGHSLAPPQTQRPIGVGYLPGVPRLGIPELTFTDGPAGVRITQPTTAMPAPVALAATFSDDLARDYGTVLGNDARARRQDVVFSPMLNTARVPQGGRNFESLGEDPYLTGLLGAAQIEGIQATGTIATAKHLAANSQEENRLEVDVSADERTLNEIELRGFETAVTQGRPGSVMCSYSKVNGVFACENPELMQNILRNRWGWSGFVVSDYGANHSGAAAMKAGLDVEFLGVDFLTLKASLAAGQLTTATLDAAVGHILGTMQRFGLLAGARPVPAFDEAGGATIARTVAERGAVLLRNENDLLPLDQAGSVAVIGETGRQLLTGGGGSSRVAGVPERLASPLKALTDEGVPTTYAVGHDLEGTTIPAEALTPPSFVPQKNGLLRAGTKGGVQVDPTLDFTGSRALPAGAAVTWNGSLTAPETGDYLVSVQTTGAIGALFVDGELITGTDVDDLPQLAGRLRQTTDGLGNPQVTLQLTQGRHSISVDAAPFPGFSPVIEKSEGPVQVRLTWVTPAQRRADLAAAVRAARAAHTAVVFAHVEGTEGKDRPSLALPDGQDALISAVAAANPRTVVVLNSGYPVLMPWLTSVGAVLDMWYPGQEGGRATSDLLLGKAAPGGRLPVTFPASERQTPVGGSPSRYPGVDGVVHYSEGVFSGYRWYDEKNVKPLFPFGFGLSYTSFEYRNLSVRAGATPSVSFDVTNTGARSGTAVPQVYAGRLPVPVDTPPQQLAGVDSVVLNPGETRHLTIQLDVHSLSYWNTTEHTWTRAKAQVPIKVAESSRAHQLMGVLG
jgi:beta-glucosidase